MTDKDKRYAIVYAELSKLCVDSYRDDTMHLPEVIARKKKLNDELTALIIASESPEEAARRKAILLAIAVPLEPEESPVSARQVSPPSSPSARVPAQSSPRKADEKTIFGSIREYFRGNFSLSVVPQSSPKAGEEVNTTSVNSNPTPTPNQGVYTGPIYKL